MAPWEITYSGGSVEHYNEEPGQVWMERIRRSYDKIAWINPVPKKNWHYTQSIEMTQSLLDGKMYPLTLKGLEDSMQYLAK